MAGDSNSECNLKKRKAYAAVDTVSKANELRRRRQSSALRRISAGSTSAEAAGLDASLLDSVPTNQSAPAANNAPHHVEYAQRAFTNSLNYPSVGQRSKLRQRFGAGDISLQRPKCLHCLAFRFYHEFACKRVR